MQAHRPEIADMFPAGIVNAAGFRMYRRSPVCSERIHSRQQHLGRPIVTECAAIGIVDHRPLSCTTPLVTIGEFTY